MNTRRRIPLSREQVIDTALKLMHEVGLDGLTTRRLAAELQVQSPALYWHFSSKQELLDAMADAILTSAGMGPPGEGEAWQAWLLRRARSVRSSYLRYREGARLVANARRLGPAVLQLLEAELEAMVAASFTPALALRTIGALSHYVTGFVLQEQSVGASGEVRSRTEGLSPEVDVTAFPLLLTAIRLGGSPVGDEAFEHGVQALIAGTEAALAGELSDSSTPSSPRPPHAPTTARTPDR